MKTHKSIKQISVLLAILFTTSVSYAQLYNSGGYQGGGHGSGGDETLGKCQELYIFDGWSGISTFVSPYEKDAENIFAPIESSLTIVYNQNGMYWPATGTNTIGPWDAYSGYVIKVNNDSELSFCGDEVSNKTVSLNATWDLIPVLSATSTDVESLFAGLAGFELAKAIGGGGVYWPLYNINTLIALEPGKAYYVYTTSPGSINFSAKSEIINFEKPAKFVNLSPWHDVHQTPATHLVAITKDALASLETDDIIGVFTGSGLCAGLTTIYSNETVLSINGDDAYTDVTDGFAANENISYKLYRPSKDQAFDLEVTYDPSLNSTGKFQVNGLSAISGVTLTGFETLSGLEKVRIYPNPSTGIFNIEGINKKADVKIYSAFGEEIISNEMNLPQKIDLSSQAKGVYFIRIFTKDGVHFEKLVVN